MSSTASRSRRVLALVVLLFSLPLARTATGDAFEEARRVFQEGQSLYAKGEYGQAAEKYTAAYRLMRSPLLFFNIAQARRLQFQKEGDYEHLVEAREHYERFLAEADPEPRDRARAEANLREVESASVEEAKKRFDDAEESMRLGRFAQAIDGYEAAYELSRRPGILFNLAQAQRKQFQVDGRLERLSRAEDLILTFRREAPGQVAPEVLEELLAEIRTQRAEYHRRREAEARTREPPAMREARDRYERGDVAGVLEALARAEATKGNEKIVLLAIYRLRGQAAALAGDMAAAEEAFQKYLALEPAADGTGLRDEAVPAFQKAKAFWKDKEPLRLEHLPPGKVPPGRQVTIPIRVASDPLSMIARRELRYRRQGDPAWQTVELSGTRAAATLPPMPSSLTGQDYRMEYYVVAMDENGAVLDTLGAPNAPLAFIVTESVIERPPPVYKRWWFWAAAGAVAVGAVSAYAISQADGIPDFLTVGDHSEGAK